MDAAAESGRGPRPKIVKVACLVVGLLAAACFTIGLWPILDWIWPYGFALDFEALAIGSVWAMLLWFTVGCGGLIGLRMLWRGSPRGPAYALSFSILALCLLHLETPYFDAMEEWFGFSAISSEPWGAIEMFFMVVPLQRLDTWLFFAQ